MTLRGLRRPASKLLLTAMLGVSLGGCLNAPVGQLTSSEAVRNERARDFGAAIHEGIEYTPLPRDSFRPQIVGDPVNPMIGGRDLDLRFPTTARIGDLVNVLTQIEVPVVVMGDDVTASLLSKALPFQRYKGSFEELLRLLGRTNGLVYYQRDNHVYIGGLARYAVALPQNDLIMDGVVARIGEMGAREIIKSVDGGQVIYQAAPDMNANLIQPYLERLSRNLATVTMQVAVVSLAITDNSSQGFDWSAFKAEFDTRLSGRAAPSSGTTTGDQVAAALPALGTVGAMTGSSASITSVGTGTLFGRSALLSFTGAINFLSTFGDTKVVQNVELRTISGREVVLRSGQEVPYISGVSATSAGENVTGTAETSKVQTGLTLKLEPYFDSGSNLVTLDLDLEQRQVLQFIELSAGTGVGTITQPLTQDQRLNDLIRIPVGQTVVIGGLQNENTSETGTEPSFARGKGLGSKSRNVSRNAFFIVVRPTVNVFRPGE